MATRSRRPLEAAAAVLLLGLAACGPSLPAGVSADDLDEAISHAVGDPNTCVLIAQKTSGRVVHRYNTATVCAKEFPACGRPGTTTVDAVLRATVKDGEPRTLSCFTTADHSRGVGWAAGPIAGTSLIYAAVMEGDRAFPGRMMAERLDGAFRRAKLSRE